MVTLDHTVDLSGILLPNTREILGLMAYQMTEAYFKVPGVREDYEKWLAEREQKQNAPGTADPRDALPGAEGEAPEPERVIGDIQIIAQNGGDCNGGF